MAFSRNQKVVARTRVSNGIFAVEKGAKGVVTGSSGLLFTTYVVHFYGKWGEATIGGIKPSQIALSPIDPRTGQRSRNRRGR